MSTGYPNLYDTLLEVITRMDEADLFTILSRKTAEAIADAICDAADAEELFPGGGN